MKQSKMCGCYSCLLLEIECYYTMRRQSVRARALQFIERLTATDCISYKLNNYQRQAWFAS
jgi:hypothetical protein